MIAWVRYKWNFSVLLKWMNVLVGWNSGYLLMPHLIPMIRKTIHNHYHIPIRLHKAGIRWYSTHLLKSFAFWLLMSTAWSSSHDIKARFLREKYFYLTLNFWMEISLQSHHLRRQNFNIKKYKCIFSGF